MIQGSCLSVSPGVVRVVGVTGGKWLTPESLSQLRGGRHISATLSPDPWWVQGSRALPAAGLPACKSEVCSLLTTGKFLHLANGNSPSTHLAGLLSTLKEPGVVGRVGQCWAGGKQ